MTAALSVCIHGYDCAIKLGGELTKCLIGVILIEKRRYPLCFIDFTRLRKHLKNIASFIPNPFLTFVGLSLEFTRPRHNGESPLLNIIPISALFFYLRLSKSHLISEIDLDDDSSLSHVKLTQTILYESYDT